MNSYQFAASDEAFITLIQTLNQELSDLLWWQDEVIVAVSSDFLPCLAHYSAGLSIDWQRVYFYALGGATTAPAPLILSQHFQAPHIVVAKQSESQGLGEDYQKAKAWLIVDDL